MTEEEQTTEETQDTPTETPEECPKSVKKKKPRTQKQIDAAKKNLKPFTGLSHEEAVKNGRKGGQANKERIERLKSMSEWAEFALSRPQHGDKMTTSDDITSNDDLKNANLSNIAQIVYKQIDLARKGDTRAAIFIRDLIGENPTEKHEVNTTITEKPNKKKILQIMQKLDENPDMKKELLTDD